MIAAYDKRRAGMRMVNWQVTATTIYCDAVDDEVTLLVHKDGSAKCVSFNKYGKPDRETFKLLKNKSKKLERRLDCEGPECRRVIQYRDNLFAEETKQSTPGKQPSAPK